MLRFFYAKQEKLNSDAFDATLTKAVKQSYNCDSH